MPWLSYDLVQYVNGRNLICDLLSALEGAGYNLLGSVDMTVGNDSRDGMSLLRSVVARLIGQEIQCFLVVGCEM